MKRKFEDRCISLRKNNVKEETMVIEKSQDKSLQQACPHSTWKEVLSPKISSNKLSLFKHSHTPQFTVPCWSSTRKQRHGARYRYGMLGIQVWTPNSPHCQTIGKISRATQRHAITWYAGAYCVLGFTISHIWKGALVHVASITQKPSWSIGVDLVTNTLIIL